MTELQKLTNLLENVPMDLGARRKQRAAIQSMTEDRAFELRVKLEFVLEQFARVLLEVEKVEEPSSWVPVKSSTMTHVLYNLSERVLLIKFTSGVVYSYYNVPETVYRALMAAESKGRYFNQNIKSFFTAERTSEDLTV